MSTSFVIVNNPAQLPWQTNVYDALIMGLFLTAAISAAIQYRRGERMYALVMVSGLIYGVVLELAGMATLNMYVQGNFLVMLNFPVIPLFAGTTAMPLYVTLFYPVIFSLGYRIVVSLGIAAKWQAAVTGGLFMVFLDAPYIIEGNLRHVVWWTWDSHFKLFQFWLGWPLVDMAWEALWGAMFYYLMLRAKPHVDGPAERWPTARVFAVEAPFRAILTLIAGQFLLLPLIGFTFAVGPQGPFMVVTVAAMAAVAVVALRTATPRTGVDGWLAGAISAFVVAFAVMVVANVGHEHGLTAYIVVQTLGLLGVIAFTVYPLLAARRQREPSDPVGVAPAAVPTGARD